MRALVFVPMFCSSGLVSVVKKLQSSPLKAVWNLLSSSVTMPNAVVTCGEILSVKVDRLAFFKKKGVNIWLSKKAISNEASRRLRTL